MRRRQNPQWCGSRRTSIGFRDVTALFCMQMGFTVYAKLRLPQMAEGLELARARLLGVVLLLAPLPARLED